MAPINVTQLLQEIATAVDLLNGKAEAAAKTKLAFETAQTEQLTAAATVESLRAQVHDLLGQVQTRAR